MKEEQRNVPPSERRELVVQRPVVVPRRLNPVPAAAPQAGSVTPAFVLQVFSRWWTVALPVGLILGGAAASAAWWSFKPTFVAEAWVRIEDRRPFVAFPSQEESKRFMQTQVEMIRSPVVLSQCLSHSEIAQMPEVKAELDPLKWIGKRLTVTPVADSELFRIKVSGHSPANAAKIANAIVEEYLKRTAGESREEAQKVIDVLEIEQTSRMREMQRMRENVRALAKQVTGKDFASSRGPMLDTAGGPNAVAAALEHKLTTVEVERESLNAEYESAKLHIESQQRVEVPGYILDQAVESDPQVVSMTAELHQLQATLQEYEHTSKQPDQLKSVQEIKKRAVAISANLEKRKQKVLEDRGAEIEKGMSKDQQAALSEMATKLQSLRRQESLLRDRIEEQRKDLEKFGDQAVNLDFARSELERAEEVYRRIADRMTALKTEQSARARVSSWSTAIPPSAPETTAAKLVGMTGGGMFVLPFALAVLWEIRVRRIANVQQLQDEIRLPVIGEITALPVRSLISGRLAGTRFERDRSTFQESVAQLRTTLMLSDDVEGLQVIVVASAVSREGKTSIAAQLATNLANASGAPTLLVDADLRDPDIHEMFSVPLGPGLAEVLTNHATPHDAIRTRTDQRLQFLTAGQATASTHALFSTDAFPSLLETLRSQYRYIIIDCPPLLAASEALVVAKAADGTLLCTMRDVSRAAQVRQARDRLTVVGAKLLGVVLSGVSPKSYASRYGGYGYATVNGNQYGAQAHYDDGDD